MLRKIFLSIGVLCVGVPAQAVKPEQLEVLGVRLAGDLKTTEAQLVAQGYRKSSNGLNDCSKTYEKRMAELVKAGRERFLPTQIICSRNFAKGSDRVHVDYLLAPRGFVVSGLEYSFRSTESSAAIEDRLVKKFGAASERTLGNPRWYTNRVAKGQTPYLQLLGGNGSHNLQMQGGTTMKDTFVEETRKDLKRRMPLMRSDL